MNLLPHCSSSTTVVFVVATAAMIVDLSCRRIPNAITLPAVGAGLVLWFQSSGWSGALAALAGAVLSPVLLIIVHAGRRPGMGDLKLTAAVGSLLGPVLGGLAVLVSATLGGLLAIAWALRPGTASGKTLGTLFVGIPWLGRLYSRSAPPDDEVSVGRIPIPYGLAIGVGSIVTAAMAGWR